MNKKLLYLFLIVAGLFMGKTANAVTVTLTDDLEVPGYVKSNYFDLVAHTLNGENFATDDQSLFNLVDANIDNEKNNFSVFRDNYGIQNQQTSSRIVTIYKSLSKGDIVIVQGGCTGQYGTAIDVLNADAETINGAEDYSCFIMTSNAESLEISLGRLTYISAILIMTKDASADELEVAKSNYASAVTAYNSAKDAAVVDEEFVDDTKLFWHPTSALTAYNAAISSADEAFEKAQISDENADVAAYTTATETINALVETINNAFETYNATINMPAEGKQYVLRHSYSGKCLLFNAAGAELSDVLVAVTFAEANDSRVFIKNAENLMIQVSHSSKDNWTLFGSESAGGSNSSEWLFIPQNDTEYRIQTPTQGRFMGGTGDVPVGNKKDTEGGIEWTVEEYPAEVNVAIAYSDGLATYTPSVALDFTNAKNIVAYKATAAADGVVSLTKVEQVAAGEGVLIYSMTKGATSEEIPVAAETVEKSADNMFVGTLTDIDVLATEEGDAVRYILNDGVEGLGFYRWASTAPTTRKWAQARPI